MRIAVGGFLHESHSFAPVPTTYRNFVTPGGAPPLVEGPALLAAMAPTTSSVAGAMAEAGEDVTLVPLAWGAATPAGPVQDEAFERIAALICANLSRALDEAPLDGIFLNLHGAGVAVSFPDLEGELLRRVRAIAGDVPLNMSLDPHCNLTREMVDLVDAAVPYRTYPHVDAAAEAADRERAAVVSRVPAVGFLDAADQPMHAGGPDEGGVCRALPPCRSAWGGGAGVLLRVSLCRFRRLRHGGFRVCRHAGGGGCGGG
jgi:microcystin degradation protein MlrC